MPSQLDDFAAQLKRCGQSPEEIRAFVEAFAQIRVQHIAQRLTEISAPAIEKAGTVLKTKIDWADDAKLTASGLQRSEIADSSAPELRWLHVDVASDGSRGAVLAVRDLLIETCMSEKQRKALFPSLSAASFKGDDVLAARLAEVPALNRWLRWARSRGIHPGLFGDYHLKVAVHGASQNVGGNVGAVGGSIAIFEAIVEITGGKGLKLRGALPDVGQRDPLSIDAFLRRSGLNKSEDRPLTCILLHNHRAIIFASDPDVAIVQSLNNPFTIADEAWKAYSAVRKDARRREKEIHEFAVGEIKTATDPSNLHERMALSTRETRSERQANRFLMMAILTEDLLTGAAGKKGRRNTRAPMQSREMGRVGDVFNLHHAWGWDGGRQRHPEHWEWFKSRLKTWANL